MIRNAIRILPMLLALSGCASLTVTNVKDHADAKGIRYSLPQPVLQVVPQADGTVAVDVLHIADSDRTYAIDADSELSSYTYQVSISQSGLLNAVEFKQDTSAVGQQLAATAGAATAQSLNIQNAQVLAAQTATTTAQTAVDAAKTAADAAAAQLQADTDNNVTAKLNDDRAVLAQAQAKLQDAQTVLDRVRSSALAVSITASGGTPVTTTSPSLGTTGFGAQTWTAPTVYDLPSYRGAVLYVIDDGFDANGKEIVTLKAQTFNDYPPSGGGSNIPASTQQAYPTTAIAQVAPTLGPQGLTTPFLLGMVKLAFSNPVKSIAGSVVVGSDGKDTGSPVVQLDADNKTITLDINKLKPGTFVLTVGFIDIIGQVRSAAVKFSLS